MEGEVAYPFPDGLVGERISRGTQLLITEVLSVALHDPSTPRHDQAAGGARGRKGGRPMMFQC